MLVSFIVYKLAMTETRSRRHSDDTLTVRLIVNPKRGRPPEDYPDCRRPEQGGMIVRHACVSEPSPSETM
jgi:hypothetical protein